MPGSPAGTIALRGFETLNLANGQLSINIPLLAVYGRGSVSVPLNVPLNGNVWDATAAQYSIPIASASIRPPWRFDRGIWIHATIVLVDPS